MSRTKRKEKTKCKDIRTHLRGDDANDQSTLGLDVYFKKQNRKYKRRKQELKGSEECK